MGSMTVPTSHVKNLFQQFDLLGHELVVDNFAGGGGASEGIEQALGRPVDLAINHDETAIAVHKENHRGSLHSVADVWDINPVDAVGGRPVGLAWFSPDCRHFSLAKGGRPVSKSVRGLAWVSMRWAALIKPRVICLENVSEFLDWTKLIKTAEGKVIPDPATKGATFRAYVQSLRRHGYEVDWKILHACDYGTPTIRKRLFLIARRDGRPIVWPKPTHGAPGTPAVIKGKLKPWVPAADCIDWSIPCPSIFERSRPLAEATMKRIAKGVMRYVVESENPYLVPPQQITPFITEHANASSQRNMAVTEPLRTQCAQVKGGHFAVVTPVVMRQFGNSVGQSLNMPLGTITAGGGGKSALVSAFLAKHYTGVVGADLRKPTPTVTTTDHNAVVSVSMMNMKGSDRGGRDITDPMPTVCAGGTHAALVAAFMAPYYGKGSGETGRDLNDPSPTITTKDRFQLVTVTIDGQSYVIVDIRMRMLQPHELAKAQGFPSTYKLAKADGRDIPKYKQVRLIGNSVCPLSHGPSWRLISPMRGSICRSKNR